MGKTGPRARAAPRCRAHPRSRGENSPKRCNSSPPRGSSPLTWGKPRCPSLERARLGLIPAHAGKISSCRHQLLSGRAHPRSRGENPGHSPMSGRGLGSSPLTRGKFHIAPCEVRARGLIPAHAGKIYPPRQGRTKPPAHPRSRGENAASLALPPSSGGSSPLTRGKWAVWSRAVECAGLIPAHAGKIDAGWHADSRRWAHPRSRGENSHGRRVPSPGTGSSPLTRGKFRLSDEP